jgi:hypothetical protein
MRHPTHLHLLHLPPACTPTPPHRSRTNAVVITDPENPKFDLEKVIESWVAKA